METYRLTFRIQGLAAPVCIQIYPPQDIHTPEQYATRLGEHGEALKYILVDVWGAAHLITIATVLQVTIEDVTQ